MMLREGLRDEDIPHRTTVRNHILEVWDEHLDNLAEEMQVGLSSLIKPVLSLIICYKESLGKISFTTDMWSDPNLTPFMAVTAHWIESITEETASGPRHTLKLRADLVGFNRVPGRHDGEHLAHAFLYVLERVGVTRKVCI